MSRVQKHTLTEGEEAPQAIQVSDRFNLLCNLTSAVERVLETRRSELAKAYELPEIKQEPVAEAPSKMNITPKRNTGAPTGPIQ